MSSALFDFLRDFKKGTALYRVFRKLSYVNQPEFLWRSSAIRIPAFSIFKKGAGFEDAYTFRHEGLTCLLFPFKKDMELDMGKLAVWRLGTHSTFGGT